MGLNVTKYEKVTGGVYVFHVAANLSKKKYYLLSYGVEIEYPHLSEKAVDIGTPSFSMHFFPFV